MTANAVPSVNVQVQTVREGVERVTSWKLEGDWERRVRSSGWVMLLGAVGGDGGGDNGGDGDVVVEGRGESAAVTESSKGSSAKDTAGRSEGRSRGRTEEIRKALRAGGGGLRESEVVNAK